MDLVLRQEIYKMILMITMMKETMPREKEELLAVRSNLVLANLCAANLLRSTSTSI